MKTGVPESARKGQRETTGNNRKRQETIEEQQETTNRSTMATTGKHSSGLSATAARIAVEVPFVAVMLIGGAVLGWGFRQYYFDGYWAICGVFLVLSGIAVTWAIHWERQLERGKLTQGRLSMNYLALTTCKFVAVVIFLLILWNFNEGERAKAAVLIATVLYIIGLILETIAFTGLTKYYAEKAKMAKVKQ